MAKKIDIRAKSNSIPESIKNILQKHTVEDDIFDMIWETDISELESTKKDEIKKVISVITPPKSKYSQKDLDEAKLYIGDNDPTKWWLQTRDYFRNGPPEGPYHTWFFLNNWANIDENTKKEINESYEKTIWKGIIEERNKTLVEIQNRILSKKWMETGIRRERIKKKTDDLVNYNRIARWDYRFCFLNEKGKKMFAMKDKKQYLVNKANMEYLEKYVDAMSNWTLDKFLSELKL